MSEKTVEHDVSRQCLASWCLEPSPGAKGRARAELPDPYSTAAPPYRSASINVDVVRRVRRRPSREPAVSDFWTEPTAEEEASSRRRAGWGVALLVVAALLVVGLVVLLTRSGGGRVGHGAVAGGPAPGSGSPPAGPSTTQPATSGPTSSSASVGRSTSTRSGGGCPTPAPCVIGSDDGGVVAALNAFRASHGASAVAGSSSTQAQQCALNQGDGPACEPHYAWQPVPTRDGAKVISMIASSGNGTAWLLDPRATSVSVGWAYQPGGGGTGGQYECAILKVG
jgi:hypothetical protein